MLELKKGMTFTASYSGGKDSALAILRAIEHGMELRSLLITFDPNEKKSWFHGIPEELLQAVEEAAGVPVHLVSTQGDDYNQAFETALKKEKEAGIEACVFGDIDIEEHLNWGKERCAAAGLLPVFPLWQENRKALAEEALEKGFVPRITVVNTRYLPASFVGRALTKRTLQDIEAAGADPCGENGEYHTFTGIGPLFSHSVPFELLPEIKQGDYVIAPLSPKKKAPAMKRGYVQVYTGNGKGKTTASMGLMLRAAGADLSVFFGQFMKQGEKSEIKALSRFSDNITICQYGNGKELATPDKDRDRETARQGFFHCRQALLSGKYDMVVLDEILVAAYLKYISQEEVLSLIEEKPLHTELVLTGRYASQEVMDKADLVTEMKEIRHYYKAGVRARKGIEK